MTFSGSAASIVRATFTGSAGVELSARLDLPAGRARAYALFAHCFTCSKGLPAAKRIASELARSGIGVLRFANPDWGMWFGMVFIVGAIAAVIAVIIVACRWVANRGA